MLTAFALGAWFALCIGFGMLSEPYVKRGVRGVIDTIRETIFGA